MLEIAIRPVEEWDELKQEFKRFYLKDNLNTYLDYDRIERLKNEAKVSLETKKPAATEDGDKLASSALRNFKGIISYQVVSNYCKDIF